MAGAPLGNNNASKSKIWTAAINRALEKRSRLDQKEAIDALAEKLLTLCDAGDLAALRELGDRMEGKPAQSVVVAGDQDSPLKHSVTVDYVKPDPAA